MVAMQRNTTGPRGPDAFMKLPRTRKRMTVVYMIVTYSFMFMSGLIVCSLTDNEIDYRQEMRVLVQDISAYARGSDGDFVVIAQNGQELLTDNGESTGSLEYDYLGVLQGVGREDLYYGYDNDDEPTPSAARDYMVAFLDIAVMNGLKVLVTDYCSTQAYVDSSYSLNEIKGYISFAAPGRQLNTIPSYPSEPYNSNGGDISTIDDARNFLYLVNTERYSSKQDFVNELQTTNFDILLIDLCAGDNEPLDTNDVLALKTKANGGQRLIIAYMSIGEAEDYRYYWKDGWIEEPPDWLAEQNPDWPGNYKVRYWEEEWQDIIFGNDSSYIKRILNAGFDGVYLDIIDAFEYFENL